MVKTGISFLTFIKKLVNEGEVEADVELTGELKKDPANSINYTSDDINNKYHVVEQVETRNIGKSKDSNTPTTQHLSDDLEH